MIHLVFFVHTVLPLITSHYTTAHDLKCDHRLPSINHDVNATWLLHQVINQWQLAALNFKFRKYHWTKFQISFYHSQSN